MSLYLFFKFFYCSTMSSFVYLYSCMYIWLNCIYLYLNVYCQCLMLTVCTKGLRVTQLQFSVCMYCTCGRIDNKTYLTWLDLMLPRWSSVPLKLSEREEAWRHSPKVRVLSAARGGLQLLQWPFQGEEPIFGMLFPQIKPHEPHAKGTSLPKLASGVIGLQKEWRASQFRYISGRKETEMYAHWRSLHPGTQNVTGLADDVLRALRRDGHHKPWCITLFPSEACPHKSWPMGTRTALAKVSYWSDCPQTCVIFLED